MLVVFAINVADIRKPGGATSHRLVDMQLGTHCTKLEECCRESREELVSP